MDGPFAVDQMLECIGEIQALISPFVLNDPYYPLDYGFSHDDFLSSGSSAWGSHVEQGILQYIEQRRLQAQLQLEDYTERFVQAMHAHSSVVIPSELSGLMLYSFTLENGQSLQGKSLLD